MNCITNTINSISQPISLSAPVRTKRGKVGYKNPFEDENSIHHSYFDLWSSLQKKFKNVNESLSKKFIADIMMHIKSYKYTGQFITALALLTGVNVSDHDILFQLIKQEIKSITKYPVVFVQSHHDVSVKPVIERIVQSFLSNSGDETQQYENDDDQDDDGVIRKLKKSTRTFTRLQLWYESRESNEDDRTPLIIIIPDVESFCSRVLNDLFSILSVYKRRIPFIIILGIATDLNALHQRVSVPVLEDFDLTIFKIQPSLKFLDLVLEEIFLTAHCPFQLHGKILEKLIDAFKFYNFSVESFIRGIQFCIINHLWNSDLNILCCPTDRIPDIVDSLDSQQLNSLLKLTSACNYNSERKNAKLPLMTKKNIKEELVSLMGSLPSRISRFHVAVRCFYIIVKSVSNSDYKTLRDIYCQAMQLDLTKTQQFKEYMMRFKLSSVDTILETMNDIEEVLRPRTDDLKIEEYIKTLVNFRRTLERLDCEGNTESCSPRKRTQRSPEITATLNKSPRRESVNVEISLNARKNSFGRASSPHKKNLIPQRSPKKEQVDPHESLMETDILYSSHEKLNGKDEPRMLKKVLSLKNDSSDIRSSLQRKNSKKRTLEMEISSPVKRSSDSNTMLSKQKSPHNLPCTPATKSLESVDKLIASVCIQSKTPTTPVNVLSGLYIPSSIGSRNDFQKSLRKNACQNKRPTSMRDQWKFDLVEFLVDIFFKEMLECPTNYTFHEILMYKDLDQVKNNFIDVNQRTTIEKALQDPQSILKCKCCKLKTSDEVLNAFPDLCITYKLLLERSSEDVDVKSLLTNFGYVVLGPEKEEITPEVYNRFRQTLRDLQLMGFIKPHKNKTDFVKKVTIRMK